jgi:hypothetical protein
MLMVHAMDSAHPHMIMVHMLDSAKPHMQIVHTLDSAQPHMQIVHTPTQFMLMCLHASICFCNSFVVSCSLAH